MAKTIAFIPVRGNSKSISGKNIRLIAGKPLIAWSLEAAVDCLEIDQVIVATDCQKIIETVQSLNLKKLRSTTEIQTTQLTVHLQKASC